MAYKFKCKKGKVLLGLFLVMKVYKNRLYTDVERGLSGLLILRKDSPFDW